MKKLIVLAVMLALAVGAQANLLSNAGFETALGAGDWATTWGTGQFVIENWNHYEGAQAIHFKGTWAGGTDWGGGLQQVGSITPGTTYDLGAQFYADNGWSASAQSMKLEFLDSGFAVIGSFTANLSGLTENTWQSRTVSGLAPAGSAYAQVVLEASGIGGGGIMAADAMDLSARVIPEPTTALLGLLGAGLVMFRRIKR